MRVLSCEKCAKQWESNLKSFLRVLSLSWIFDFDGLFLYRYWSQAGISHFDDQKATFQGARGVKCGKSTADTVAVEVYPSTAPIL